MKKQANDNHFSRMSYAKSGVDIKQEESTIKALASQLTFKRKGFGAPITDIGHYAGLIDFGEYALALATDGVGSKVLISNEMKKWNTIGIDCIAMNVNDLIAIGVEPIAFVDYLAVESHEDGFAEQIGEGLRVGAEFSNMSIIGGETATLPDVVKGYDLAGTCLGMVRKDKIIDGSSIEIGDAIIGIESSGVHSNGYTLVRKIIEKSKYSYIDPCPFNPSITLGEELLKPTRIYMKVLSAIKEYTVHGLAHITGSGLLKLSRITNFGFDFYNPIVPHNIFKFLQEEGNVDEIEMYKTFNMGMGFLMIVPFDIAEEVAKFVNGKIVGKIVEKGIKIDGLEIK